MLTRKGLLILAVIAVTLPSVPLGAAEDPVGEWIGTTEVPDQGTDQVVLTIRKADGGYGGLMTDSLGMVAKVDLQDVQFADGILSFGFSLTDGAQMTMKLKVTGDKMTGEWRHPEGDVGTITFERKKA